MLIDLILDRKDGDKYVVRDLYNYVQDYTDNPDYMAVARALDAGTEADVISALCDYISHEDYNPEICDYICSVSWLKDDAAPALDPESDVIEAKTGRKCYAFALYVGRDLVKFITAGCWCTQQQAEDYASCMSLAALAFKKTASVSAYVLQHNGIYQLSFSRNSRSNEHTIFKIHKSRLNGTEYISPSAAEESAYLDKCLAEGASCFNTAACMPVGWNKRKQTAKSSADLYAQWNRIFDALAIADWDAERNCYRNELTARIDRVCAIHKRYQGNIEKHFNHPGGWMSNTEHRQPISRAIYAAL
jgi:hypothetical protein